MKTIRYLAALLMVITGILHVFPMFKEVNDPNAIPMLGFGVAFIAIGILLFLDKMLALILGIALPLIGLGIGFGVVGLENWDTMLTIMFVIDPILIICCIILLINRKKVKTGSPS